MHTRKSSITFIVLAFVLVIIITFIANSSSGKTRSYSSSSQNQVVASSTQMTAYTLADVAKHAVASDCWTAINGGVYNLTPFVDSHPGGVENITKICGIDGTMAFDNQHGGQKRPANELTPLQIGTLK